MTYVPLIDRLAAMLREVEGAGRGRDGDAECPRCGGEAFADWVDHRPDCPLDALLKEVAKL